jgi:spore coat polysaccharide biosynthesis predicted glycosyltransferase SpsG
MSQKVSARVFGLIRTLYGTGLKITLMTGYGNRISEKMRAEMLSRGVIIVDGTDQVGKIMAGHDIALASSGYVKYELAALGIPALLVSIIDHQKKLARGFTKGCECARYLGDIFALNYERIKGAVMSLSRDSRQRAAMSKAGSRCSTAKLWIVSQG